MPSASHDGGGEINIRRLGIIYSSDTENIRHYTGLLRKSRKSNLLILCGNVNENSEDMRNVNKYEQLQRK